MKTIKQTINLLLKAGYSQQTLAKIAKVSQMTISRWSKTEPKLVNIAAHKKLWEFAVQEETLIMHERKK